MGWRTCDQRRGVLTRAGEIPDHEKLGELSGPTCSAQRRSRVPTRWASHSRCADDATCDAGDAAAPTSVLPKDDVGKVPSRGKSVKLFTNQSTGPGLHRSGGAAHMWSHHEIGGTP